MTTAPPRVPWQDDPYTQSVVVERAMQVMRLDVSDADQQRIFHASRSAAELMNDYMDRGAAYFDATDVPEAVLGAAVQVTIELYRRKDAPFGVTNGWSQLDNQYGVNRPNTDWLKGVETQLAPFKLAWGIG